MLFATMLAGCARPPVYIHSSHVAYASRPSIPPAELSDESPNRALLRLAREQGQALQQALEYMLHQQSNGGEETRAGDYLVAYAVEYAEGWYAPRGSHLVLTRPEQSAATNAHVEVVVRDGADGRFVPGLTVYVTLIAPDGKSLGTKLEPFMWHPWLYHYGENWRVPISSDDYRLRVRIEAPTFRRHDAANGRRYNEPVEIEFTHVRIKTGQK